MKHIVVSGAIAIAIVILGSQAAWGQGRAETFVMEDANARPIKVHTYVPDGADADTPVLLLMHGVMRNAEQFRDTWIPLADRYRVIVAAPEFAVRAYPRRRSYATGFIIDEEGKRVPATRCMFKTVDGLFDVLKQRYANTTARYYLFGHSAGGAFVHRMLLHSPARVAKAIAANPVEFSALNYLRKYPIGLSGAGIPPERLVESMATPLVLLMGGKDNYSRTPAWLQKLRQKRGLPKRKPGVKPHKRARMFIKSAQAMASAHLLPLRWSLEIVPGVGHDRAQMSRAAAAVMFSDRDGEATVTCAP